MKKSLVALCGVILMTCATAGCQTVERDEAALTPSVAAEPERDTADGPANMDIALLNAGAVLPETYEVCIVDAAPHSSRVVLSPGDLVTDVRVVSVEYVADEGAGDGFRITGELFSAEELTPERPLVLQIVLPETIPAVGIIYGSGNGEEALCTIATSGLDGAPLLVEGRVLPS